MCPLGHGHIYKCGTSVLTYISVILYELRTSVLILYVKYEETNLINKEYELFITNSLSFDTYQGL